MVCRQSSAPDHRDLTVKRGGQPSKLKKFHFVTGLAPDIQYSVYNNNITTLERAIKERVFYVNGKTGFETPPRPAEGAYSSDLADVTMHFRRNVRYSTPMTHDQFVDCYQGRKRTIYAIARDSIYLKEVEIADSYIKAFGKFEKYNFTAKPDAVPRVIQPRDPRYGISVGRYIKPIEKHVYKLIDSLWGSSTIMKGLNMQKRGRVIQEHWTAFEDPVAIGLDASRFDQHVSYEALEWEHSIYRMYYPGDKDFKKLLSWQLYNRGTGRCSDGRLKYKIRGKRMSGDMNTALGNCLIMSSLVYAHCRERLVKARLVNDGDDCVVVMNRSQLSDFMDGLQESFTRFGFTIVAEAPVYSLEEIVFCQAQPVFDGLGYVMVRDPRVSIAKDCTILTHLPNDKIFRRWMASVGVGGESMTGGIPVCQDFYSVFTRGGLNHKPLQHMTMQTGLQIMGRGMSRKYTKCSTEARVSFYRAFGITPEAQMAIEGFYKTQTLQYLSEARERVALPL